MILMIDNYDSFTYNLVRYCFDLGVDVVVKYHDEISISDIKILAPAAILLSPGPCTPDESGICLDVVRHFAGQIPILGICLGHQVICQVFGGTVGRAKQIVHGKTSRLFHTNTGLFFSLPQGYQVTRYHSLVAKRETLPDILQVTAWTLDEHECVDEVMGLKHRDFEVYGVQFHPEALLTEHGYAVLGAFFAAQGILFNQAALQLQEVSYDE